MLSTSTTATMPDLHGRTVVITGANSGLGLIATEACAAKGAQVIMACRSMDKAEQAADSIRQQNPQAQLIVAKLDTSDLAAVRAFADYFLGNFQRLDILINNAGIMAIPRGVSRDGFELQFATNHLGHFALTGLLLQRLNATPDARVVTVSSLASMQGVINFDDLMGERKYDLWGAYNQSKLANLLFALELQKRLKQSGASTLSLAAHPGISTTNLFATPGSKIRKLLIGTILPGISQSAEAGTWPVLLAATGANVQPGGFYGPTGFMGFKGAPGLAALPKSAQKAEREGVSSRLWEVSEKLTGIHYAF